MGWEKPKYSKEEINNAGRILTGKKSSEEELLKPVEILDNWRASHSYPLHIFQMRLKDKAKKVDKNSLVAQRLKRVPAILYKLKRSYHGHKPSMKLYQMQDLGGCRAILSNVALAKKLYNDYYIKGDLKHKKVGFKDYIENPKEEDGYRSIHVVYSYKTPYGKRSFNGLLTEVQIRSRLQHLWATAVETTGFFTRQAIKSHEGDPKMIEFFKLVSSAFAKMEGCPNVPNTPQEEKELYIKIKEIEKELNILKLMRGWKTAKEFFEKEIKSKKNVKFFLLELDILGEKLMIKSYTEKEEQKAIGDYSALEKRHNGSKDYDVVLVGADTTKDLKKAYPNYFVDIDEFLKHVEKIISKY